MRHGVVSIALLAVSLVACAPAAATATLAPTGTPTPTDTPAPTPTGTPVPAGLTVSVPEGIAPTIDGTLSPGEWDGASEATFSDGSSTLFLMHAGGYLYVGIRGTPGGVGIVANILVDQGDHVAILHTSAALGTATFQKEGDLWRLDRDFDWRARTVADSPLAQQERQRFFEQEGWLASITPRGALEDTEYQIGMPEGWLRLVVLYVGPPDYNEAIWWPASVDDDCPNFEEFFREGSPDEIHFAPETWALVIAE